MSFPSDTPGSAGSVSPHLILTGLLCLLLLLPATTANQGADTAAHITAAGQAPSAADADQPALIDAAHPLDPAFQPPDLTPSRSVLLAAEAAAAFNALADEALNAGVVITAASGYRSFQEQASLHEQYTLSYGARRAREISAPPGTSEHQSGLAVDIANPDGACALQACFGQTPAGKWAAEQGWRFGFIIRYPQGGEAATGYTYEPWHLRYVGTGTASAMRSAGEAVLETHLQSSPRR